MTRAATVKAIRQALYALAGTAVTGLVLTSYAAWALATLPARVSSFLTALTPEDQIELATRAIEPDAIARAPEENLPQLVVIGAVSLALGLVGIAVGRGYAWGRTVVTVAGVVVVATALIFAGGDTDFAPTRLFDRVDEPLSPGAMAAYAALLPPGFRYVHYLAELVIAGCLVWAIIVLRHPDAREFLMRRRESADRILPIRRRD